MLKLEPEVGLTIYVIPVAVVSVTVHAYDVALVKPLLPNPTIAPTSSSGSVASTLPDPGMVARPATILGVESVACVVR